MPTPERIPRAIAPRKFTWVWSLSSHAELLLIDGRLVGEVCIVDGEGYEVYEAWVRLPQDAIPRLLSSPANRKAAREAVEGWLSDNLQPKGVRS